ncbi:MAG: hypothetical protein HUJ73_03640 [Eubacterium sp.]|nr:hypothetical protein [Eubacterium sp.]
MPLASLLLGILAIVLGIAFGGVLGWLGIIFGIIGIIIGVLARGRSANDTLAIAGLIFSIIGSALSLLFWISCAACLTCAVV